MGVLLAACSASAGPGAADDGRLKVVATTGQIGDAVKNIAGERVELATLLGPGIDPHTYVATEGDLFTFQEADVILYNGLHLEAQLERVLGQIGESGKVVVAAVGERVPDERLLSWEPASGFPHDPHIWNDVQIWRYAVEGVRDTLIQADPDGSAEYSRNATVYLAQLDELHAYITEQAATLPPERRVIVTAHDAFNYLGRAYGFEVEAVQGVSTQSEASTAGIRALADIVLQREVPAIFVESTISPRTVEAVQEAVRSAGREVQVGGELYSDALGAADSDAGSYIGMMRHNIDTIVAALGS
jgi:manganese/zinc/iron transport system substrate-binding protein